MLLECLRIQTLLQRKRAGLSDPERLVLEEHMAACPRCTQEAAELARVVTIADSGPSELRPAARQRIIAQALVSPVPSRESPRGTLRFAAAAVAAAGVLGLVVLRSERAVEAPIAGQEQPNRPTAPRDRIALAHALLDPSPSAKYTWDLATTTLRLERGWISIAVDPAPQRAFRVVTDRFVVVSLGSSFEVDPSGLRVIAGEVRVLAGDGSILADGVRAGDRWQPKPKKAQRAVDRLERLARARRDLASGRVESARRKIQTVLASDPARPEEAEAIALLAECALVAGEPKEAVRLYRQVASRFSDLGAGETALFAAARLEAEAGETESARTLLKSYLKRHPNGRFRNEAQRRLESLDRMEKP